MKDHPYVGISHSYLKVCKLRGVKCYPGGWDRGIMGHNKATYLKGRKEKKEERKRQERNLSWQWKTVKLLIFVIIETTMDHG